MDSGIDTATIEAAIAREEAALVRALGGPLEGERTDTLYPAGHDGPLTLRRFAAAVTVTSDGATLDPSDVRLVADGRGRPGAAIKRASGALGDVVTITSTPDDAEAVKRYLIEAVRRALVPDSERAIGEGRSQAGAAVDTGRALLCRYLRDLQPQAGSTSVPSSAPRPIAPGGSTTASRSGPPATRSGSPPPPVQPLRPRRRGRDRGRSSKWRATRGCDHGV